MFKVTEEIVLKEMNVLNEEMFEGLLDIDAIEIDIDFLDAEWGYCVDEEDGRGTILGLTDEFDSYESFRTILAHEMIHLPRREGGRGTEITTLFSSWLIRFKNA